MYAGSSSYSDATCMVQGEFHCTRPVGTCGVRASNGVERHNTGLLASALATYVTDLHTFFFKADLTPWKMVANFAR